jgi:hypothetical protein
MQWKDIEPRVRIAQKNVEKGPVKATQNIGFMLLTLTTVAVVTFFKMVPEPWVIGYFLLSFCLVLLRMALEGPFGVRCLACKKWLSFGRRGQVGPLEFLSSEHRCANCGQEYD